MSSWSTLEIAELRRIANFVYDQSDILREEEKDRKRKAERHEVLKIFAAMHNNVGQM